MTPTPSNSQRNRTDFGKKALYDHDHHPFPFQKRRNGQELIWGLFVKKKGSSIYCQSCKAWVGWAKVNQKAQPQLHGDGQRRPVLPLQPRPPYLPSSRRGEELFRGKMCLTMTTTPPISQKRRTTFGGWGLCMTMTTTPSLSHLRRRAFVKKAVYDHDHQPFPFPYEEECFSEEGCV